MTLRPQSRPEILTPPEHPPACCTQQTLTIAPRRRGEDPAETRLPLRGTPPLLRPPHRRRTGLLHHQGPSQQHHQPRLVPPHGPATTRALARRLHAVRNQRILADWDARQADNQRRAAAGLPPRTRKRRRKTTLASLTAQP